MEFSHYSVMLEECIAGLAVISVLLYGGTQVMNGQKTIGDLISFLGALLISYEPIRRLTQLSANMQEGLSAARRVFDILDKTPKIKNSKIGAKIIRVLFGFTHIILYL